MPLTSDWIPEEYPFRPGDRVRISSRVLQGGRLGLITNMRASPERYRLDALVTLDDLPSESGIAVSQWFDLSSLERVSAPTPDTSWLTRTITPSSKDPSVKTRSQLIKEDPFQ